MNHIRLHTSFHTLYITVTLIKERCIIHTSIAIGIIYYIATRVHEQRAARLCRRQPLILDLNFWHRSFLTTIMVDHYPLFDFEFACMIVIIGLNKSSFMLYVALASPPRHQHLQCFHYTGYKLYYTGEYTQCYTVYIYIAGNFRGIKLTFVVQQY